MLILFSRTFRKRSKDLGKESFQLTQSYLAGITDQFNGMKDIKSNSLEKSHLDWFLSLSKKMEENRIRLTALNTTSQMIFKIVSAFLIAVFIFFSVKMFTAQPAQVMLIMVIFSRLWPRLTGIQSTLEQLNSTIPSFTALIALHRSVRGKRAA